MRTLKRKIFSFSDCAYYTYTFNERATEERRNSMAPFDEVLRSLTIVIQNIMNEGFFVRGGAVVGDIYVDDKGIFGPAAEKAYELESKHAKYPRILLEQNFGSALLNYGNENYFQGAQPIVYEEENAYFLNMFYGVIPGINCGLNWDTFFEKILRTAQDTIDSLDNTNISEIEKEKIKQKMQWISNEAEKENEKLPEYIEVVNNSLFLQLTNLPS